MVPTKQKSYRRGIIDCVIVSFHFLKFLLSKFYDLDFYKRLEMDYKINVTGNEVASE